MNMPVTDPAADADVLDHIEAADPVNPPDDLQDNPLQHVSEDQLLGLDSVMVQMPAVQEEATTAVQIATEAAALRKRGTIHALEAENLATLVPAIQGAPDSPVSYTSVPTTVGVSRAVELLEGASADTMNLASTKASDCVDRAMAQVPTFQNKFESEWLAAQGAYTLARTTCAASTGGPVETNYGLYLGPEQAPVTLSKTISAADASTLGPQLAEFGAAMNKITGTGYHAYDLVRDTNYIRIGEFIYNLGTVAAGEPQVHTDSERFSSFTYGTAITAPMVKYPEKVKALQAAHAGIFNKLSHIKTEIDGWEPGEGTTVARIGELISQAALYITFLGAVQDQLNRIVLLTNVATAFFEGVAKGGAVPAAERYRPVSHVRRRFF